MDTLVIGSSMIGSQEDGTILSMHHYNREGPTVGLTWSSILLDLSTSGEGQTCGWSRSVKLINVSLEHERRTRWTHWYLEASWFDHMRTVPPFQCITTTGEGLRVGLTWSSLLDLSTMSEVQICGSQGQ